MRRCACGNPAKMTGAKCAVCASRRGRRSTYRPRPPQVRVGWVGVLAALRAERKGAA
ncbi:MAG: hypothetical protein AB7P99_14010 [Vicinamibacterales bacterium]